MNDGQTHWHDCWIEHHLCALKRIRELEEDNVRRDKQLLSLVAQLRGQQHISEQLRAALRRGPAQEVPR